MRNRTKKFINAYTFIVICMNVLIIGCFEDKGNYEYSELNEIHIDTLASPWRVDFQEEVILTPNVVTSKESEYEYYWLHLSQPNLIDALSYEESEFRQTEWEFLNKGSINIKSYSHYTELKAKDKEGSFGVSLDKIAMTEKFDRTLDMFFLLPFDFNIYVSETLKDKMESCGIKGISFPSSVIF